MKWNAVRLLLGALAPLAGVAAVDPAPAAAQQSPAVKVAYVNTVEILDSLPEYTKAKETYKKEAEGYDKEMQQLRQRFDSMAGDFERQSTMLNASQRETRRKELQEEGERLQRRFQEVQQKINDRERELLEPIQTRINSVIEGIRAEGGYAIIFDVSAPNSGIVTADRTLNLTQKVVGRLK